jgi:hypothetical protein
MREEGRHMPELLWYAGGLIPLIGVSLLWVIMEDQAVLPQRIVLVVLGAIVGGICLFTVGEALRPPTPARAQSVAQLQQSAPQPDVIYQAGVIVGKVFGGRRAPTDATVFEFQEITHASQFNYNAEFEYQGYVLRPLSIFSVTDMTSSRPQDGRIVKSLTARIIRQK